MTTGRRRNAMLPAAALALALMPLAATAGPPAGPVVTPVQSGGDSGSGGDTENGNKLSKKLDEALQALIDQMQPALKNLSETLKVFEQIDSLENYQRPEILPNGDIVIRRRPDAPPWQPPEDDGKGIKT